jgi:hypothetical protein
MAEARTELLPLIVICVRFPGVPEKDCQFANAEGSPGVKWSRDAGEYLPFDRWQDISRFFYEGANIRLQVTIPGRRRKEALGLRVNSNSTGTRGNCA